MIFTSELVNPAELLEQSGWEIKPQGACKDERCVPLPAGTVNQAGQIDLNAFAKRLNMPVARDPEHGLVALGPESGGKALTSATAPDLTLPDLEGRPFRLSSLRGRKVLLVAWASW